ncbi:MAG: aldolase/citrate lyase family protein, partial [Hydrogenophaga sp.]|nr:aldolase/citrate lyase family protein [Hydrogenophaga sp.]
MPHPRDILAGAQAGAFALPVCDHYSGVEARMRKSLQLQAEMTDELGACVFDVTLDCEDGAPVGGEVEHAALVTELVLAAQARARVAVRVHPVDHPHFDADVASIAGRAAARLTHLMVPKVESVADVQRAVAALDAAGATALPLHVLIESPAAVHRAFDIAAHPRVQSLSFGLMDFVSAHGGAIPASAMGVVGQFGHPLVLRAKLDMASACHAHGKVPSHCVVTEFKDL